ncbi:DUF3616 domain-containing protein [Sciscionella sediminilitoris]|uniref:DUF3616 domain-containing protein n=1 Tax=Sciscionella sediminilitoris TaxID=1445613 RepID=UPI0004DFCD40|nr:DUF3616 domain-containing protein [Sciscionella sp. SE31]
MPVSLRFHDEAVAAQTHVNLSAVHAFADTLWIAGDETATIERLRRTGKTEYGEHTSFGLADFVRLPGDPDEEVDIEGMALVDGYLWVVGSHSAKRKKPKEGHSDDKIAKRLGTVSAEPARRLLARLAIEQDRPVRRAADGRCSLALGKPTVFDAIAEDPHLGPFVTIPSKDNGLDIEGIAVHGQRVFLGLRGPVLRGWACVLQLEPRAEQDRLKLGKLDGSRYAKHFLDLDGLGVRDLCEDGEDLLVLAGPTMDLDGPVRVYRWRGAARLEAADVVPAEELERVLDLPYGEGTDHAEGITLLADRELLVVYDSPDRERLRIPGTVLADVFAVP